MAYSQAPARAWAPASLFYLVSKRHPPQRVTVER